MSNDNLSSPFQFLVMALFTASNSLELEFEDSPDAVVLSLAYDISLKISFNDRAECVLWIWSL